MAVTHSTDTPGRVIPILEEEFEDFDTESTAFLRQQRDPDLFTGFRLKQGVYGQRQADVQMIRVKLPFGGVSADQLDALRRSGGAVRTAEEGPRHHTGEHPVSPRAAAVGGDVNSRAWRRRAVEPGGLRQHRAQRDGRPVGRCLRRRSLRRHALRRRLRALFRAASADAAPAAEVQGGLYRVRGPTASSPTFTTSASSRRSGTKTARTCAAFGW